MLNMITKSKIKSRGELPADYRATLKASSLDALIAKLKARRRAVHEEICSREAQGEKAKQSQQVDVEIGALALLNNDSPDHFTPAKSLADLFRERLIIDRALELAEAQRTVEVTKRLVAELSRRRGEYDASILAACQAIIDLRRALKGRDDFLESVCGAGRQSGLPCAFPMPSVNGGELHKFISEAVRAGIIAQKEIEK
jgi:hypothetical protein